MARANVRVDGLLVATNFDAPRAGGRILRSLVVARLVDEIADLPLAAPVAVSTDLAGARARTSQGGIAGLVGTPDRAFPRLDASAYSFDLGFAARGFVPWRSTVALPPQPGFPDAFDDLDLGPIAMRRTPFVLTGRAVSPGAAGLTAPCPGATVSITGLWQRATDIDPAAGAPAVPALAVLSGLSARRPAGTTLEIVALPPVPEAPRLLLLEAEAGDTAIRVGHSVGLLPGGVVGIDGADPDRAEHVEIASLAAPNDPNSPATAILRFPLRSRHRSGASVQRVSVPAPGPADAVLADDGAPGDATLFVDTAAALSGPRLVRIAGGASAPEYATCAPYAVVSDADGFYRLPPLGRVAAFEVSASRPSPLPALNASATPFTPNYALYENRLDLLLR